jgi:hypothetical protein
MRLLWITALIALTPVYLFSQKHAKKFDEFPLLATPEYYACQGTDITRRTDRLMRYLRTHKGSRVYIISYHARKSTPEGRSHLGSCGYTLRGSIGWKLNLEDENVISMDGGYRDKEMLEFWIGDRNSSAPIPTPKYNGSLKVECVNLTLYQDFNFDEAKPASFSVNLYPQVESGYKWTVSNGKILSGQGTGSITVDLMGTKTVTVFVEATGVPEVCERVAFETFEIGKRAFLVDSVEKYNVSYISMKFDVFLNMLHDNPSVTGYIIGYSGRGNNDRVEANRALESFRRLMAFRRLDSSRLKLIDGGFREYTSADFWLVPPGAEPPSPTPSVDASFISSKRRRTKTGR